MSLFPKTIAKPTWLCWIYLCLFTLSFSPSANGQDLAGELEDATAKVAKETYLLEYQFKPNKSLHYEVVNQTAVQTKVEGNREEVQSRTKALKILKFGEVNAEGGAEFSNIVDFVSMWSKMTARAEERYDSRVDADVPATFQQISGTIGKPLSTVKADKHGEIVSRDDHVKQINRGTGGLLLPLPKEPVAIGTEWQTPSSVQVKKKSGQFQEIKLRKLYTLKSVRAGIATITVKTQVLTPIAEPEVKSQLVQKLSNGEIKFDIDNGLMRSKILDWDETVIGFNGPQSSMSFLSKMQQKLVPVDKVAALREPPKVR